MEWLSPLLNLVFEVDTHVSIVIAVLGVSADGDGGRRRDTVVDTVDGAEGVDVDLEVGQGFVRAWLEGNGVASGCGVESVDRREDGVGVLARASASRVSGDISSARVPV